MQKGSRVTVIPEMRGRFWDIGVKVGIVADMDGFAICEFPGIPERMRIKPEFLEVVE